MRALRSLNQDMPATKCNQGNEPRSMLQNRGCCSFLGAQPIKKEIHPKLRVERTIHSKDHHQRNLTKNKPNQKKTESKVPDTYPHLTPRNQEKTVWTFIVTTWNHSWPTPSKSALAKSCHMSCSNIPKVIHCNPAHPTACASLDLKQVKVQGFFNGEWMEEISPKIWEGNDQTVLTQGYIYHPWISMISSFWANTSHTSASKEIWKYAIETIETVTHTHTQGDSTFLFLDGSLLD